MTVAQKKIRQIYQGNGAAKEWPFYFSAMTEEDVKLKLDDEQIKQTLYKVDLAAGRVIYPLSGAAVPTGRTVMVYRDTPLEQGMDLTSHGGYYPESVEEGLDNLEMQIQELADVAERALQLPLGVQGFSVEFPTPIVPDASLKISTDGTRFVYGVDPDKALANSQKAASVAGTALEDAQNALATANTGLVNSQYAVATADKAFTAVNSITVKAKGALSASQSGYIFTAGLNIDPGDRVLAQSVAGLLATVGMSLDQSSDFLRLTGRDGSLLGSADFGYIADMTRSARYDLDLLMNSLIIDPAWMLDGFGNLMLKAEPEESTMWERDENGDWMLRLDATPSALWTLDENGDAIPI